MSVRHHALGSRHLLLSGPKLAPAAQLSWRLPGRWPDGGLSEGYGYDGPGVCLDDGQTEAYLEDMGMTGLTSAWAMA